MERPRLTREVFSQKLTWFLASVGRWPPRCLPTSQGWASFCSQGRQAAPVQPVSLQSRGQQAGSLTVALALVSDDGERRRDLSPTGTALPLRGEAELWAVKATRPRPCRPRRQLPHLLPFGLLRENSVSGSAESALASTFDGLLAVLRINDHNLYSSKPPLILVPLVDNAE